MLLIRGGPQINLRAFPSPDEALLPSDGLERFDHETVKRPQLRKKRLLFPLRNHERGIGVLYAAKRLIVELPDRGRRNS